MEPPPSSAKATSFFIYLGRVLLGLSALAFLGAWFTQLTGGDVFGMTQQHLFNDAIVLALLGIGSFLDALWHARNL